VDFVADFENGSGINEIVSGGHFGSVLILNVLEHTFNPIAVLDNAVRITKPGGTIIFVTPAVWPLHNFPIDSCRLLPDWYRRFAATRNLVLDEELFSYLTADGFYKIAKFVSSNGQDNFPPPDFANNSHRQYSRFIHKFFKTFGRGMFFNSHIAIGGVFRLPS